MARCREATGSSYPCRRRRHEDARARGVGRGRRQHCFRKQFGGEGRVAGGVGMLVWSRMPVWLGMGGVLKTGGRDKGVPRMDKPGMAVADVHVCVSQPRDARETG
jgi:hypothetical protein